MNKAGSGLVTGSVKGVDRLFTGESQVNSRQAGEKADQIITRFRRAYFYRNAETMPNDRDVGNSTRRETGAGRHRYLLVHYKSTRHRKLYVGTYKKKQDSNNEVATPMAQAPDRSRTKSQP